MCTPESMALMAIGSSAMQVAGQASAASAQDRFNQQRLERGTDLALRNFRNQTRQAYTAPTQKREAVAQEINQVWRESRKRAATAQSTAAEAGVSGASVQALLADYQRKTLAFETNSERNLEFYETNLEDQLESLRMGAEGRIESLRYMPAQRPSFLGSALRIGMAGVQGYVAGTRMFGTGGGVSGADGIPQAPQGTYGTNFTTPSGYSMGHINPLGQVDFTRSVRPSWY